MPTESYEIEGHLRILTGGAENALTRLGGRLSQLGQTIAGTGTSANSTLGTLLGFGAAYAGVHALGGAFQRLTGWAVDYQRNLEGMQIGLSAVISATDSIPFDQARERAGQLFEELRSDAITSVATTSQLFDMYQQIYGPLHGAGQSMEEVRETTSAAVAAATALNVPLDMAAREMNQMVAGSAGMHNRLYAMLHATNAIAEDAHEWNQLTAPERVSRLTSALGRFGEASEAYGHSFAGVTSTFQDIAEQFTSNAFGASFEALRGFLDRINTRLLGSRDELVGRITHVGEWLGDHLEAMFGRVESGMDWLVANFDGLIAKGERFVNGIISAIPLIQAAAEAWVGISIGRSLLGGGISMLGSAASLAGGLGYAPTGAAGSLLALAGSSGAESAGFGVLSTALTALTPLLPPIAAAFALIAGVGTVVVEHLESFAAMFESMGPTLGSLGEDFEGLGSDLWEIVHPALGVLGDLVIVVLVPALELFVEVLHILLISIRGLLIPIRAVAHAIDQYIVQPLTGSLLEGLQAFSAGVGEITSYVNGQVDLMGRSTEPTPELSSARDVREAFGEIPASWFAAGMSLPGLPGQGGAFAPPDISAWLGSAAGAPGARQQTVNHFHGNISVRQEFRDADPDRVLFEMMDDISRQAESRITSGFTPPFVRG